MKINKSFMRSSSFILLVLSILPLFLEAGNAAMSIGLISIGALGCLWSLSKIYEELKWNKIKLNKRI